MSNQSDSLKNLLNRAIPWLIALLFFLFPFWPFPFSASGVPFQKQILILAASLVLFLLWGAKILAAKKVKVTHSPLDLPLLLFFLAFSLSFIFSSDRLTSLFGYPGSWHWNFPEILALVLLFYTVSSNLREEREISRCKVSITLSVLLLSIISLLSYLGVLKGTPLLASSITLGTMLLMVLSLSLGELFNEVATFRSRQERSLKAASSSKIVFYSLSSFIILATFLISSPWTSPLLSKVSKLSFPQALKLDLKTSWFITSGALRERPFLGSGPSTFLFDFTRYKPVDFNNSRFWNIRFDAAGNEILEILATTGVLGILTYLFFAFSILRLAKSTLNRSSDFSRDSEIAGKPATSNRISLPNLGLAPLIYLGSNLLVPSTSTTAGAFFLLLALWIAEERSQESEMIEDAILNLAALRRRFLKTTAQRESPITRSEILPWLIFAFSFALFTVEGFFLFRAAAAHAAYGQSLARALENKGKETYDLQRRAISLNPYLNLYHRTYGQTNLALANSLASQTSLTDDERTTISQLIQQAIREARIVTERLGPLNISNWEMRAQIYRNLIGVAENAEQWAAGALRRAIQLDPANPRLRVDLGGIYYAQGDFASAEEAFRIAVSLKPNYANAYYNLALTLEKEEKFAEAKRVMEQVLALLPDRDSADFQIARVALERIETSAGEEPASSAAGKTLEVSGDPTSKVKEAAFPAGGESPAEEATPSSAPGGQEATPSSAPGGQEATPSATP